MIKDNMWHQPFDGKEFDSIFNEYSIEPKILLKNEPKHLYDVVKTIVGEIKTFSRICLVAKIKETGPKNEKITREIIINTITSEIKSTSVIPNYFLALLGNQYILLLLESAGEKILEYIQFINERMETDNSVFEQCNILSYVEDTTYSTVPKSFLYETNISEGVMNEYKSKNLCEKSWIVYNTLCDFGKALIKLKNINDESQKKPITNSFSKFIPGSEDVRDLLSQELTSLKDFVKMYCEILDVELDEELIWPYNWHLNL